MFVFIPAFPFLTIIMIVLIFKSHKNVRAIKHFRMYQLLLGIGTLSTLLCIIFGFLGNKYNNDYQLATSDCPASYPYAIAIITTGIIGLISYISSAFQAFRSKQKSLGWQTVICAFDLVVIAAAAWFISIFCLVF